MKESQCARGVVRRVAVGACQTFNRIQFLLSGTWSLDNASAHCVPLVKYIEHIFAEAEVGAGF
jgi:hypothetical protein